MLKLIRILKIFKLKTNFLELLLIMQAIIIFLKTTLIKF